MRHQVELHPEQRNAEKRSILQGHALFGKLSPGQINRLSSCASKADPGSVLFAIYKGTVKISVPSTSGHDAVFNLLGAGDMFGEIALLDGRPRTADAVALTDCKLFVLERRELLPLLREDAEIALKIIELLCRRLRHRSEQREDVMFLDLPVRLAKGSAAAISNRVRRGGGARTRNQSYPGRPSKHDRHVARKDKQATTNLGKAQMGSSRSRNDRGSFAGRTIADRGRRQ
jgi:CRP/FNR family transcriptional regulator, cyclic AMP receptor protein